MKSKSKMKFKLVAALLGLMIAIPGAVIAQVPNDQAPDSKPSPYIQAPPAPMQGSNGQDSADQDADQDSMNPAPMNEGPNAGSVNPGSMNPGNPGSMNDSGANDAGGGPAYNAPAPTENNAVARVSLIHGDVSTQRGDTGSWSAAVLNAPVLAGDRVSTGDKARTEIQLDYANMLRLAEHSQANITQLTRSQIQIQLGHGMANYTVLRNSDADAEIDTPNVAIRTGRRESSFRILVTADDHTEVLVRKGEIEVTTPQGGTRVGQNQFITIQGTGADEQYKIGEAPARDDFDQWNSDRDNMIRNSLARKNTNDYYVGTEDLDGKGTWSEVPDYGPVWRPNEPADWAPYRDGRWVYEPYWGWTWVSYDSWGWAPYHYGRWMYVNGGWGWWPGPAYGYPYYRPIWAPAYVSFFGFGGGFGFGFGFGFGGWGGVGWLPLGPCDHFHPWYGRYGGRYGSTGWGGYNRGGFAALHGGTGFSNVNQAMHNPNFRGGTTVSGKEFGTGHMNAQAMTHAQFQNASFSTGRLPVSPSRESFSASGRPAAASTTRNVSQNQHFFSTHGTTTASNSSAFNNRSANSGFQRSNQNMGGSAETRSNSSAGSASRVGTTPSGREGGGWQKFSPMPSRSPAESSRYGSASGTSYGATRSAESNRTQAQAGRPGESMGRGEERGSYGSSRSMGPTGRSYGPGGYGGSSRPPLNMRQPIVTPRSYGGGRSAPSYGRSAPSYGGRSAPSYGGGRSAPSYGGGHSAPSSHGGGGGSHGGGGGSHGGGRGGRHGR
ncbi:MAG: FecR family protein [Terriglobales bacterium]